MEVDNTLRQSDLSQLNALPVYITQQRLLLDLVLINIFFFLMARVSIGRRFFVSSIIGKQPYW